MKVNFIEIDISIKEKQRENKQSNKQNLIQHQCNKQ